VQQQTTGDQEEVGRPIRLAVDDHIMAIISEIYANQKSETEEEEDTNEAEEQESLTCLQY
jgi:hypothetical protein